MDDYAKHDDYWNHNTAYHPWLRNIAAAHHGDVLDVGCGDGLLAQRLGPVSRSVTAIDSDAAAIERARRRLRGAFGVSVAHADFATFDPGLRRFDLIVFVASLHHLQLRPTLERAREMLTPAGEIAVVGLCAERTVRDFGWAVLCLPLVLVSSRLHRETRDVGVAVREPREGLDEIRQVAAEVLPGASIRRGLYYRYLLRWTARH